MNMIIGSGKFSPSTIRQINRCRVYLRAQNLSDITNGVGTHLGFYVINHIWDPDGESDYNCPTQSKTTKLDCDQ